MRTKRIKRKKEILDVDITSLLDILVILLFFLLQSYNTSEVKMKVPDKLNVAQSLSKNNAKKTIVMQITQDKKVFIDNEYIGKTNNQRTIINQLSKSKEMNKKAKGMNDKDINIVFDQDLPYHIVKSIMKTANKAGFSNFHFIVQGGS